MKRLAATTLAVTLVLASVVVAQASSLGVEGGVLQVQQISFDFDAPSSSEEDCKDGGWETYTDANGDDFKNQGACVSYVAGGGVLVPISGPASSQDRPTAVPPAPTGTDDVPATTSGTFDVPEWVWTSCTDGGWSVLRSQAGASYTDERDCKAQQIAAYVDRMVGS